MTTNQIYNVVNDVVKQGAALANHTVVDTQSFVSLGNDVLSSSNNTESFLNTLVQRIGKSIFSFREYRNKLGDMVKDDFEFGAIVQKVAVKMPEFEADEAWDLQDGQSVDMFKVSKPEVVQKLFVKRTPYKIRITRTLEQLKEAFISEADMGRFIASVMGEVRNAIEFGLEELGRNCLANFIGEVTGTAREIKLVTDFNTEMGLTGADALTAQSAVHSDLFLNYAIGRINHHANMMTEMTVRYNDGTKPRFTPVDKRVIRVLSDFNTRAETVTQYAAYHDKYVSIGGIWDTISYWQNSKVGAEGNIKVKRASDGASKTVNNVVAVLYDRDALGMYKKDEFTLTSPVNADGAYYNVVHHLRQLWFNDVSENFVYFTLN